MSKFLENRKTYLICFLLALLVLSVYWQVGGYSFINYDDNIYVYENSVVKKGLSQHGIAWAFTTFHAANWHPITWISHMADVSIFGLEAGWHHRVNVLFHIWNTVILFLVFMRMTGALWQSAFVAALFGVHPLHVESVAWVAERKDVLSTLFWLLTMGAYLRYVRLPSVRRYFPVAVLFALGLMCKPMLVTLPFVLLLLDYWPLRRMGETDSTGAVSASLLLRLVREKLPLFVLSVASCVITYFAQLQGGGIGPHEDFPAGIRISNAIVSYAAYLKNTFWPVALSVFYPHPGTIQASIPVWRIAGSALLIGSISLFALRQGRRRPYLAVGWLWYLGTLFPVIGLVQAGGQALADRYSYVPLIGVFVMVAYGIPVVLEGWRYRRPTLMISGGAILFVLSVTAWNQAGYWRDNLTLYTRALNATENNWLAWMNLGSTYEALGKYPSALEAYREVVRIRPRYPRAWANLSVGYRNLGRYPEATEALGKALAINPEYARGWNILGDTYSQLGQHEAAAEAYRTAVRKNPEYADAWNNLAIARGKLGHYSLAIDALRMALRISPEDVEAWNNLGIAFASSGQDSQAIEAFRKALDLNSGDAQVWYNLGIVYSRLGQRREVLEVYQRLNITDPAKADEFIRKVGMGN
jgi:tetratricopeptide (TPR) repeat protein